jgi:hypothetical protein
MDPNSASGDTYDKSRRNSTAIHCGDGANAFGMARRAATGAAA